MSCSFLIWSSLAMSANSSRKPSKLLQKERKEAVGEGKGKDMTQETENAADRRSRKDEEPTVDKHTLTGTSQG